MKEEISISFVVAIYNVDSYLERCLETLKNQSRQKGIEILLIDDGSTDSSSAICEKYVQIDNRFKYFRQDNKGVSAARNLGMKLAQGQWICFIDGDDYVDENLTENLLKNSSKFEGNEVVLFGYRIDHFKKKIIALPFPEKEGKLSECEIEALRLGILNVDNNQCSFLKNTCINYHTPWGKLYDREFLMRHRCCFDCNLKRGQDIFFNFQIYKVAEKVTIINYAGYYYRINEASISNKYNPNIVTINKKLVYAFGKEISSETDRDVLNKEFYLFVIRQFMYCAKIDFCHKDNPNNFKMRKNKFLNLRKEREFEESFYRAQFSSFRPSVRIPALLCKFNLFFIFQQVWKLYQKV